MDGLRRTWDRLTRILPWAVDAAVVGGVAFVALFDGLSASSQGLGVPASLAGIVAIVAASGRRWGPLPAFALLTVEVVVIAVLGTIPSESFIPLAPTFALAALATPVVRRQPVRIATAAGVAGGVAVGLSAASWSLPALTRVLLLALLGGVYAVGVGAGIYLRHLDDGQARAADDARRAERLDIARELHDLVAHYVTGIVVQAQAAQVVADRDPDAAGRALGRIEDAGRDALVAMRGMVGTLRGTGDEGAPMAPPVALDDLEELEALVARSRATGLPVDLHVAPEAGAAARGATAASTHRIVQESLTNVHRHAVEPTHAEVDVRIVDHAVVVTVTDDGRQPVGGPDGRALAGAGFGLVGMAERAEALAGSFAAGPLAPPGHGWRVRAVLPLDPAANR